MKLFVKINMIVFMILILFFNLNATPQYEFKNEIYVVSYIGDIDGNVNNKRYQFYSQLVDFYVANNIPVGMSFYPGTLNLNPDFMDPFLKIYFSKNIDIIQKGYLGDDKEAVMAFLTPHEQEEIMRIGQQSFKNILKQRLGTDEIFLPNLYNQIQGSFSDESAKIALSLGIKEYFDVFISEGYEQVASTHDFISIQYGVSIVQNGRDIGYQSEFKSNEEILSQLDNYHRRDINIAYINSKPVVPIWVHQQDFFDPNASDFINQQKWESYQELILTLDKDPKVTLIKPSQIYYSLVEDKSPKSNVLINQNPLSVDKKIILERKISYQNSSFLCQDFNLPFVNSTASFYGFCRFLDKNLLFLNVKLNKTIVEEDKFFLMSYPYDYIFVNAGFEIEFEDGVDIKRVLVKNPTLNEEIQIDTFVEKNKLMGVVPIDFGINEIMLELNENSSIPSNKPVLIGNFPTINDKENVIICTFKDCRRGAVSITIDDYFTTCMDKLEAVGYRGTYFLSNTNNDTIYNLDLWDKFNEGFKKGHEIGTHTQNHWCIDLGEEGFRKEIDENIKDIINNTEIKREAIVSHSHPCGFTNPLIETIIEEKGYLSARGYNINELEISSPANFFNLKTINDENYPGGDMNFEDYYKLVDIAQKEKKWANLVFHSYCNDKGVINDLSRRNVWVDTQGNVMRYVYLRDNTQIVDYKFDLDKLIVSFMVVSDVKYQNPVYEQELSIKIGTHKYDILAVYVNGEMTQYKWSRDMQGYHLEFNVPFPINNTVEVFLK